MSESKSESKSRSKSESKAPSLSHFDAAGRASMVDVSAKAATSRIASATAFVELSPAVLAADRKSVV